MSDQCQILTSSPLNLRSNSFTISWCTVLNSQLSFIMPFIECHIRFLSWQANFSFSTETVLRCPSFVFIDIMNVFASVSGACGLPSSPWSWWGSCVWFSAFTDTVFFLWHQTPAVATICTKMTLFFTLSTHTCFSAGIIVFLRHVGWPWGVFTWWIFFYHFCSVWVNSLISQLCVL